jgi:hypothetical protein
MEVIAAVLIGALLWCVGPGRRLWAVAPAGSPGARKTRSKLSAASKPPALPLGRRQTATAQLRDSLPARAERPSEAPSSADANQLQRTPITLGVALLLQALAVGVMALLFAVGYFTLELKVRADAQALERRMLRQVMALEATETSTRQALEAMQASLAAQVRALEQLEAHLESSAPKPTKPKSHPGP